MGSFNLFTICLNRDELFDHTEIFPRRNPLDTERFDADTFQRVRIPQQM